MGELREKESQLDSSRVILINCQFSCRHSSHVTAAAEVKESRIITFTFNFKRPENLLGTVAEIISDLAISGKFLFTVAVIDRYQEPFWAANN